MRKVAIKWVLHVFEEQQWTRYGTWHINMEGFGREGDFLYQTVALDETLARACKQEFKNSLPNYVIRSQHENTSFVKIRHPRS